MLPPAAPSFALLPKLGDTEHDTFWLRERKPLVDTILSLVYLLGR